MCDCAERRMAKDLMYCDMEGFFISEDGQLVFADECGNFRYYPSDRFKVVFKKTSDEESE